MAKTQRHPRHHLVDLDLLSCYNRAIK